MIRYIKSSIKKISEKQDTLYLFRTKKVLRIQKQKKSSIKITFLIKLNYTFARILSSYYFSMKKRSGFTLIELMVVMAIIAILATAGLTAYSNYLKKARDSSRALVARQILTAVENLSNGGRVPTGEALIDYLEGEG
jgi:prepilin-type N-terminal cleavage/methylation domain-containing protein